MPRRTLVIAAALVALVAIVAVIVVLGGDSEDPDPTPTTAAPTTLVPVAQWREQVGAACERLNEEYAHLEGAEPGDAEEAVAHTRDVEALAQDLAQELERSGLPAEGRSDAQQLRELTAQLSQEATRLREAAEAAEGSAIDEATAGIEELGDRLNQLAERAGVPACGGY